MFIVFALLAIHRHSGERTLPAIEANGLEVLGERADGDFGLAFEALRKQVDVEFDLLVSYRKAWDLQQWSSGDIRGRHLHITQPTRIERPLGLNLLLCRQTACC